MPHLTLFLSYQIVYTLSKAQFSIFVTWTDLGSVKHQTQAEVDDAVKIIKRCVKTYGEDVASVAVDNAARGVGRLAILQFPAMNILLLRDPGHCIDLLSKDLLTTLVIKSVVADAKEVRELLSIDRIDSIRHESIQEGEMEFTSGTVSFVETRMNLVHDFICAARLQHDFLQLLRGNGKYHVY
jgi:hypothetical protein